MKSLRLAGSVLLAAWGLAAAQSLAHAQTTRTITVKVPEAGQHFVRIIPSPDAKQSPQLPHAFTDQSVTVPVDPAAVGAKARLAVDDAKTGNTAILPLPTQDTVDVRRADFDHVHQVNVRVTYNAKPVVVARVTLTDREHVKQTKTIDSSAQGVASFTDVAAGSALLAIEYGDKFNDRRDIEVSTDHPGTVLDVAAPVSNQVQTIDVPVATGAPATTAPSAGQAPAPGNGVAPAPAVGGSPIVSLIQTLIEIALGAGIFYALYRWFKSGNMAASLKSLGVEVNNPAAPADAGTPWQPNAPQPPVVTDPTICPFCGQKKDAAGGCACAIAPGAAPASAVVTSEPRLVGSVGVYSGSVFPLTLNGAGVTVGRDPSNGVPLPNDTTVSRRHATLRNENGGVVVADEGSANGIYVNGVRVAGSQPLRPGDELQIGNTRFRFEQ